MRSSRLHHSRPRQAGELLTASPSCRKGWMSRTYLGASIGEPLTIHLVPSQLTRAKAGVSEGDQTLQAAGDNNSAARNTIELFQIRVRKTIPGGSPCLGRRCIKPLPNHLVDVKSPSSRNAQLNIYAPCNIRIPTGA